MLTPVAQAVTDRLYNDDKISKGGPVKKSSTKATWGRGRPRQTSSVNSTGTKSCQKERKIFLSYPFTCHIY